MKQRYIVIILLLVVLSIIVNIDSLSKEIRKDLEKGFYLNGEYNVVLKYGQKYEEAGFMADINNKNMIKKVKIKSNINYQKTGDYQITYTLSYFLFNKTITRNILVIDTEEPVLTVNCSDEVFVAINGKVNCTYKATDNYDLDLTDKVIVESNVNTSKRGNYKIKYTVSDSSGNTVSKTISVLVRKKNELNYIKVYISKQILEYYRDNKLIFTTKVTTGKNNATRRGNFKILSKARNTTLKGKDYEVEVAYWMGYGGGFGLHDAPWRRVFGTMDYKTKGSHGCVNLPSSAAKKLYSWVEVGTPLYIK